MTLIFIEIPFNVHHRAFREIRTLCDLCVRCGETIEKGGGTVLSLIHANALFGSSERLKRDPAVNERKKRIVPSQAYVLTRMDLRAVLPDEDVSGAHMFSAEFFHTQTLSLTVSTVS
jgi:hypothetical protein